MIFVTIGTQAPFDRLISAMDEIAALYPEEIFVAQVYSTEVVVKNMEVRDFLSPVEFDRLFSEASLIVSHAGMGTIISALTIGKPIVIMPRKAYLNEHRNEHQLATARKFKDLGYVHVADDEKELKMIMESLRTTGIKSLHKTTENASSELIASIRRFINGE